MNVSASSTTLALSTSSFSSVTMSKSSTIVVTQSSSWRRDDLQLTANLFASLVIENLLTTNGTKLSQEMIPVTSLEGTAWVLVALSIANRLLAFSSLVTSSLIRRTDSGFDICKAQHKSGARRSWILSSNGSSL